jgi:P27 family predicted phage terminase small subunit
LHELAGNPGKRKRAPRAKIELPAGLPEDFAPPRYIGKRVAAIWLREVQALRDQGYIRATDLKTFALYCSAAARFEQAQAVLEKSGLTYQVKSKHGTYQRPRPELAIVEKAERQMTKLLEQLGLTTKTRTGIGAQMAARQLPLPGLSPTPDAAPHVERPMHGVTRDDGPLGFLN